MGPKWINLAATVVLATALGTSCGKSVNYNSENVATKQTPPVAPEMSGTPVSPTTPGAGNGGVTGMGGVPATGQQPGPVAQKEPAPAQEKTPSPGKEKPPVPPAETGPGPAPVASASPSPTPDDSGSLPPPIVVSETPKPGSSEGRVFNPPQTGSEPNPLTPKSHPNAETPPGASCPGDHYWTWEFNQPECSVDQQPSAADDMTYTRFALGREVKVDPRTLTIEVDQRKVTRFSLDPSSGILSLRSEDAGQCRSVILIHGCVQVSTR